MKKNFQPQTNQASQVPMQGFFADAWAYLSRDGEYIVHVLPGNMRLSKHKNFYLALLGLPFVPKGAQRADAETITQDI